MDHWVGTGLKGDILKCVEPFPGDWKPYAYHKACAFRFRGSVAEASALAQTVDLKATGLQNGDTLSMGLWFRPGGVPSRTRLIAKVTYSDGSVERFKLPFAKVKKGGYTMLQRDFTLSGSPDKMTVKIINKTSVRKNDVFVDRVFVVQVPASNEGLLPLPSAPAVAGDGLRK